MAVSRSPSSIDKTIIDLQAVRRPLETIGPDEGFDLRQQPEDRDPQIVSLGRARQEFPHDQLGDPEDWQFLARKKLGENLAARQRLPGENAQEAAELVAAVQRLELRADEGFDRLRPIHFGEPAHIERT